ncbi:MAG: phosphoenolpyruvate--protein phosphotransferase [Gammaproteobacteria bacterium]
MLHTLRRIVQEVATAANLDEVLTVSVRRVKEAMGVDACYISLVDTQSGEYVLMAADGLNPKSVGRVRLSLNEGLTGLVGKRKEPVNLENASAHPDYRYFPETGEERYHAFLGVPIIHYRQVLGVLAVQQQAHRLFDQDEVAFLVTIAAQLAGAIDHAAVSGGISKLLNSPSKGIGFIQGVWGAPGIAIGHIVVLHPFAKLEDVPDRPVENVVAEETAFRNTVTALQDELRATGQRAATLLPAEARALFDTYVMLLASEDLIASTVRRIHAGNWAPGALRDAIAEHARVFDRMEDDYLRARAADIRDIGRHILMRLQSQTVTPTQYPDRCVLVGDEISVGQVAGVPVEKLIGIVCMRGSGLAHIAILARVLGIPAVMGLGNLPLGRLHGSEIVVDGYQGRIYLRPSPAIREEFQRLANEEAELSAGLVELRSLPAETSDGARITLHVNAGLLSDIPPSLASGAEGVGLYRTEFAFMVREFFPGEDEQYRIYRKVLEAFAPRPVTMRTLDIGGDKPLPYLCVKEDNPYMGWRGIRVSLDHPEIFLTQLRAMLRANVGLGNLRLLLPMISRVGEVDDAIGLLARAHQALVDEGLDSIKPQVGVMVETPSAIYQVSALAKRVDFFSIGTNDLTQYLLVVDRNNARVANLYECLHPAVLHALCEIAHRAQQSGKPVSVCGEMAGDPAAATVLMGMGIDNLSMAASNVPRVKWVIRSFTRPRARALLDQALEMEEATAIRRLLNGALQQAGLGGLVRAGK